MARLGILAGTGELPVTLMRAVPDAYLCAFEGIGYDGPDQPVMHRFEALGRLFSEMRAAGVTDVVMAGAMHRPVFDPTRLDAKTLMLVPRLKKAMSKGDAGLLKEVVKVLDEQGFHVIGAHQVDTDLTASEGGLTAQRPDEADRSDITRAASIHAAMSRVDVGQAVVVGGGICLGVESIQGTDALLRYVADTPPHLRRGKGVLLKAPKSGQDLRVDMPAIGPQTVAGAAKAGLAGIAIEAGVVLIVDRDATLQAAHEAGLFIEAVRL